MPTTIPGASGSTAPTPATSFTILLSAPLEVALGRIAARTDNPYGKTVEQHALIVTQHAAVESRLREWAQHELDGTRPTAELADDVEALLTEEKRAF